MSDTVSRWRTEHPAGFRAVSLSQTFDDDRIVE
jgi:hypothetical protein